jgi:Rieske Fe-S protein
MPSEQFSVFNYHWEKKTVYKLTRQKSVWTRAYLIPERNRTVRRQEEGKNYVYLSVFCVNLGEINALLTISCCQMKHFGYVIVY